MSKHDFDAKGGQQRGRQGVVVLACVLGRLRRVARPRAMRISVGKPLPRSHRHTICMRTIKPGARCALLALVGLYASTCSAHGGAGTASCMVRLGAWRVEIAAYQSASRDGEIFCDALPSTGASVLLFDIVDAALTTLPLEIRIVRAGSDTAGVMTSAWDSPAIEAATVARLPAALYPDGALVVRHKFSRAGDYLALLRAPSPGGGEWRAAFRFTVGAAAARMRVALAVIGAAALLAALLAWAGRRAVTPGGDIDIDVDDDKTRIGI